MRLAATPPLRSRLRPRAGTSLADMDPTAAAMLEGTGVRSLLPMVMLLPLLPEGPGGAHEPLDQQRYESDEI
jgi:hypothetical protein